MAKAAPAPVKQGRSRPSRTWFKRRYRRAWHNFKAPWVAWEAVLAAAFAGAVALWTLLPDGDALRTTSDLLAGFVIIAGASWSQSEILIRARKSSPKVSGVAGAVLLISLVSLFLLVGAAADKLLYSVFREPNGTSFEIVLWWAPRLLTFLLLTPFALEGAGTAMRGRWWARAWSVLQLPGYWITSLVPLVCAVISTQLLFAWRPSGNAQFLYALGLGKFFLISVLNLCSFCFVLALTGSFLRDLEENTAPEGAQDHPH